MKLHYRRLVFTAMGILLLGVAFTFYARNNSDPLATLPIQLPEAYTITASEQVQEGIKYTYESVQVSNYLKDPPIYVTVFSSPLLGYCAIGSSDRRCYGTYNPEAGNCYSNPRYDPKAISPAIVAGDFMICDGSDGDAGSLQRSLDIFDSNAQKQYRIVTVIESGVESDLDLTQLIVR